MHKAIKLKSGEKFQKILHFTPTENTHTTAIFARRDYFKRTPVV